MLQYSFDSLTRLPPVAPSYPETAPSSSASADSFDNYLQRAQAQPDAPAPPRTDSDQTRARSHDDARSSASTKRASDGRDSQTSGNDSAEAAKDTSSPDSSPKESVPASHDKSQDAHGDSSRQKPDKDKADVKDQELAKAASGDTPAVVVDIQNAALADSAKTDAAAQDKAARALAASDKNAKPAAKQGAASKDIKAVAGAGETNTKTTKPTTPQPASDVSATVAATAAATASPTVADGQSAAVAGQTVLPDTNLTANRGKVQGKTSGKPSAKTQSETDAKNAAGVNGQVVPPGASAAPVQPTATAEAVQDSTEPSAGPRRGLKATKVAEETSSEAANAQAVQAQANVAAAATAATDTTVTAGIADSQGDAVKTALDALAPADSKAPAAQPAAALPSGQVVGTAHTTAQQLADAAGRGNKTDDITLTQSDRVRFVQRVEQAFRGAADQGGSIQMQLSPPELGSLHIKITVHKGELTAHVQAETTSARNLLLDNLPTLRDRLAQQDIKVQNFDVDLMDRSLGGTPDQTPQHQDSPYRGQSGRSHGPSLGDGADVAASINPAAAQRYQGQGDRLNIII